jgi:CheY-like chemotaxis protein
MNPTGSPSWYLAGLLLMQGLTILSTVFIALLTLRMNARNKVNARRARRDRRQTREQIFARIDELSHKIAANAPIALKPSEATIEGLDQESRGVVVLFVDDMASNRMLMARRLTRSGYTVLEAHNGVEALKMLWGNKVDAVVSDMMMPGMNGLRLCEAIRAIDRFKHLPFLLFTMAYDEVDGSKLAGMAGVDAFVVNPATVDELLKRLDELLKH